jgi:hypothetical protein
MQLQQKCNVLDIVQVQYTCISVIGRQDGYTAGLDVLEKPYISCPYWNLNCRPSTLWHGRYAEYTEHAATAPRSTHSSQT